MKKFFTILFLLFCLIFLAGCSKSVSKTEGLPNPWINCEKNLEKASKIAGFSFPVKLSDFSAKAMKNMIEISFLFNGKEISVRKSSKFSSNGDFSGNYTKYPKRETIFLENGVEFVVRRDEKSIYVATFGAESGYFSVNCPKGLSKSELQKIYEIIAEAESPKSLEN